MKKVESVLNGSLGWVKTRTLATFLQILFCLLSLILPKIFTIQGGEGGASASHPPIPPSHHPFILPIPHSPIPIAEQAAPRA